MKKLFIVLYPLFFTTLLIAGGHISSPLASIKNIPQKSCRVSKVYIDKKTSLMWQDQYYTNSEEGAYKNERSFGKAGKLSHAQSYCARLYYAGYSDWRLPTSDELIEVHDPSGDPFTYITASDFWTSSSASDNRYYVVFPADARQYARNRNQSNYVRCVRCIGGEKLPSGSHNVE